jgi:hypothetical protein
MIIAKTVVDLRKRGQLSVLARLPHNHDDHDDDDDETKMICDTTRTEKAIRHSISFSM